jgi:hypothetical protein
MQQQMFAGTRVQVLTLGTKYLVSERIVFAWFTAPVLAVAYLSEHEQQIISSSSGSRPSDLLYYAVHLIP